MRQGTFALSQKELQRVAVISSCVKGDLTCARAASLLNLTPRHVKRLKSRLRQGGEAALAHARFPLTQDEITTTRCNSFWLNVYVSIG